MVNERSLTRSEWKVLRELITHQRDSDKKIAESLGMAPSNFAVIKKRLIDKGVLQEVARVNMHRIPEAKVAAFVWIEYNQPVRDSLKEEFEITRSSFPIAATYAASDWSLNIDYFKSFEDAENARLTLAEILRQKAKPYIANYMWHMVPMSHLVTCHLKSRFITYSMTGHSTYFDITNTEEGDDCEFPCDEALPKLSDTEKKTLIAFRKYPNLKKSEIAKKVGIQQSSLSEVFKGLQRKGVINYIRTFDPAKLSGSEVATFAWMDLKQPILGDEITKTINDFLNKTPQITRLSYTRTFMLAIGYFPSLDVAENAHMRMLETFGENIKVFNFKIVPCKHVNVIYTPYVLEHLFSMKI